MAYTLPNTEAVSVNGMFLNFYLSVMLGMTETFKDQNTGGFNLYAHFLRACVPDKMKRADIDREMLDIQKKIDNGDFGELGKKQQEFLRGFCVVSASVNFLDDAFQITMRNAASLADITDDELLQQLERHMLNQRIRQAYSKDKERMKKLETMVSLGKIKHMSDLENADPDAPEEQEPEPEPGDEYTVPEDTGVEDKDGAL